MVGGYHPKDDKRPYHDDYRSGYSRREPGSRPYQSYDYSPKHSSRSKLASTRPPSKHYYEHKDYKDSKEYKDYSSSRSASSSGSLRNHSRYHKEHSRQEREPQGHRHQRGSIDYYDEERFYKYSDPYHSSSRYSDKGYESLPEKERRPSGSRKESRVHRHRPSNSISSEEYHESSKYRSSRNPVPLSDKYAYGQPRGYPREKNYRLEGMPHHSRGRRERSYSDEYGSYDRDSKYHSRPSGRYERSVLGMAPKYEKARSGDLEPAESGRHPERRRYAAQKSPIRISESVSRSRSAYIFIFCAQSISDLKCMGFVLLLMA